MKIRFCSYFKILALDSCDNLNEVFVKYLKNIVKRERIAVC